MKIFRKGSWLAEFGIIVVCALILSFVIRIFVVQFFYIPSGSMQNTLQIGDRIMVNKFANNFSDIKRGEVVVFKDPDHWLGDIPVENKTGLSKVFKKVMVFVGLAPNPSNQFLIKRVIGVGGDRVQCCDTKGHLKINGISVNESYIFAGNAPSDSKFDITVKKNFVWVMGDHRGASADSRFHPDDANKGQVPLKDVTGRAVFIVWPLSHAKFLSVGQDLAKINVNK